MIAIFSVARLIDHVYVLPINSKPTILLYSSNYYRWSDSFKFGFVIKVIAWGVSILMAITYFKWLGITTDGLF